MSLSVSFRRNWFLWFVAGYVAYALAFIYNSSILVDGKRHFVLFDDAMISMTYARNLARGQGVVWYPGYEPVQGYSNPLWMLMMALIHCAPLPASMTSLPVQLMGVALIVGTLVFVKQLAERLRLKGAPAIAHDQTDRPAVSGSLALAPFLAVLLTAFYLPLNNWALRGMEVGAVGFGVTFAVWGALRCADGKSHPWWLLLLLGILTTVRMDAIVAGVVILLWLLWAMPQRRIFTLLFGTASMAFFIVGQMIIQKLYYHDWMPNTYYLKLEGVPFVRRTVWGTYVLFHFLAGFGLLPLLAATVYAAANRTKAVGLITAVILGQVAYSVYVGGDAWEWFGGANRFVCVAMPLLFTLVAASLAGLRELLADMMTNSLRQRAMMIIAVLGLLVLIEVNSFEFQFDNSFAQSLLLTKPPDWKGQGDQLRTALSLQKATTPLARIAVTWAGTIPYFSERPPVDLLGKCDRRIAHGPDNPYEPPPLPFFVSAPVPYCWPGHTKRDYEYSILELQPDIIFPWIEMNRPEIADFLQQRYVSVQFEDQRFYLSKDSKEIKFPDESVP
jgi:hypothetical protein